MTKKKKHSKSGKSKPGAQARIVRAVKKAVSKTAKKKRGSKRRSGVGSESAPVVTLGYEPASKLKSGAPLHGGELRVFGCDFFKKVGTVSGTVPQWQNISNQPLHPRNGNLFEDLPSIAKDFREWRINKLMFEYVGRCGTSNQGEFIHYHEPDPDIPVFQTERDVLNSGEAKASNVYTLGKTNRIVVKPDGNWLFCSQTGSDARWSQAGTYASYLNNIATTGGPIFYGHIYVHYDIEFRRRQPPQDEALIAARPSFRNCPADGSTTTILTNFTDLLTGIGWGVDENPSINWKPAHPADSASAPYITQTDVYPWDKALIDAGTYLIEWYTDWDANATTTPQNTLASARRRLRMGTNPTFHGGRVAVCDVDSLPPSVRSRFVKNEIGSPLALADDTIRLILSLVDLYTGVPISTIFDIILAANAAAYEDTETMTFLSPSGQLGQLLFNVQCGGHSGNTTRNLLDSFFTLKRWDPQQISLPVVPSSGPTLAYGDDVMSRLTTLERRISQCVLPRPDRSSQRPERVRLERYREFDPHEVKHEDADDSGLDVAEDLSDEPLDVTRPKPTKDSREDYIDRVRRERLRKEKPH